MIVIKNVEILDVPDICTEMVKGDLTALTIEYKPIIKYYLEDEQKKTIMVGMPVEVDERIGFIFKQLERIVKEKEYIRSQLFYQTKRILELRKELESLKSRNFLRRLKFLLLKK